MVHIIWAYFELIFGGLLCNEMSGAFDLNHMISVLYLFAIANSKLIRRETEGEEAQLGFQ